MTTSPESRVREAREQLDAHVREIVQWHFSPETGCPFWLDFSSKLSFDPRKEIRSFADLNPASSRSNFTSRST